MEVQFCDYMKEEMKNSIKKIIEDSFDKKLRKPEETKASFTQKKLNEIYSNYAWNVLFICIDNNKEYSFSGFGKNFFCFFKNYGIIINAHKIKGNEKEGLKEDIKSLSNEKSELKNKLNNFDRKIKQYELIIDDYKSKLEKKNIENESIKKNLIEKEKEIYNLKKEMQQKKENNAFNKTFYTREQMIALNFESTDSRLRYAIPCLKKDLFVDVEKKLYDKFPQYKEKNNNFLVQGKTILRFKTVEENELVSGIPIIMPII